MTTDREWTYEELERLKNIANALVRAASEQYPDIPAKKALTRYQKFVLGYAEDGAKGIPDTSTEYYTGGRAAIPAKDRVAFHIKPVKMEVPEETRDTLRRIAGGEKLTGTVDPGFPPLKEGAESRLTWPTDDDSDWPSELLTPTQNARREGK